MSQTSPPTPSYPVRHPSASHSSSVRGWQLHWRSWGAASGQGQVEQAPLFLLHGWMDVGASWQFVVDALRAAGYRGLIIAPDWRGFGLSMARASGQAQQQPDTFYFPDYLGDLDALIPQVLQACGLSADSAITLAGHSMGAHAALLYAAARPERVAKLANLEGFGAPPTTAADAPGRYREWLVQLQALQAGKLDLAGYESQAAVARRLLKSNPRIAPERAHWLAGHWAAPDTAGRWHILGAAAHKVLNPVLFRVDEVQACYAAISCPVLTILAEENRLHEWQGGNYALADYQQRLSHIAHNRTLVIENAGHMLHHDQPQAVAQALCPWLQA
ncbi:MAG: alpha/beta fold hydrolase [Brachymonas sp.]